MNRFIALLRAVNVGGRNRLPMADLRELCGGIGWRGVRTYIQSGNVVFAADGTGDDAKRHEVDLERAIRERFELDVPAVVRSLDRWLGYLKGNPFPEAAESEPSRVLLMLSKAPPKDEAVEALRERAKDGERIERVDDAIWIHHPGGVGRSKLTPVLLDRLVGSPVTARNWRTAIRLRDLASGVDEGSRGGPSSRRGSP